jgi:hypothetical protein
MGALRDQMAVDLRLRRAVRPVTDYVRAFLDHLVRERRGVAVGPRWLRESSRVNSRPKPLADP